MSASTPKAVPSKAAPKRKINAKDERPAKKVTGPSIGADRRDQQQKSPPPPRHGVGKGLMTAYGPVVPSSIQRLVSHKEYTVEM